MLGYYNATAGRFLSVDRHPGEPRRPQSWNRYAYASNNPINRIGPDGYADFYVTTTFSHGDFHDDRVSDYLSYNATNFDISNGSATAKNFQRGLNDPEGVSIYFGHSNTTDSLLFKGCQVRGHTFVLCLTEGKQVIVYGPNITKAAQQSIEKTGATVIRNFNELQKLVRQ